MYWCFIFGHLVFDTLWLLSVVGLSFGLPLSLTMFYSRVGLALSVPGLDDLLAGLGTVWAAGGINSSHVGPSRNTSCCGGGVAVSPLQHNSPPRHYRCPSRSSTHATSLPLLYPSPLRNLPSTPYCSPPTPSFNPLTPPYSSPYTPFPSVCSASQRPLQVTYTPVLLHPRQRTTQPRPHAIYPCMYTLHHIHASLQAMHPHIHPSTHPDSHSSSHTLYNYA